MKPTEMKGIGGVSAMIGGGIVLILIRAQKPLDN